MNSPNIDTQFIHGLLKPGSQMIFKRIATDKRLGDKFLEWLLSLLSILENSSNKKERNLLMSIMVIIKMDHEITGQSWRSNDIISSFDTEEDATIKWFLLQLERLEQGAWPRVRGNSELQQHIMKTIMSNNRLMLNGWMWYWTPANDRTWLGDGLTIDDWCKLIRSNVRYLVTAIRFVDKEAAVEATKRFTIAVLDYFETLKTGSVIKDALDELGYSVNSWINIWDNMGISLRGNMDHWIALERWVGEELVHPSLERGIPLSLRSIKRVWAMEN